MGYLPCTAVERRERMNAKKIKHEIDKIDMEITELIRRRNNLISGSDSPGKGKMTAGKGKVRHRNYSKEERYFPDI